MRRGIPALADAPPRLRVGAEIMLACFALVCAVLVVHGALKVAKARLGPRNEGVLTDRVGLLASNDLVEPNCVRPFSEPLHRIEVMPGATRVAASTNLPCIGSRDHSRLRVDESLASGARAPLTRLDAHSPGSSSMLDVPLFAGRLAGKSDRRDAPPVRVRILNTERTSGAWAAGGRRLQLAAGGRTTLHTE
jgi:hypothetical protein